MHSPPSAETAGSGVGPGRGRRAYRPSCARCCPAAFRRRSPSRPDLRPGNWPPWPGRLMHGATWPHDPVTPSRACSSCAELAGPRRRDREAGRGGRRRAQIQARPRCSPASGRPSRAWATALVRPGQVIVRRGMGVRGGPGTVLAANFVAALNGAGLGGQVAVVTDGELSGLSDGLIVGQVMPEAADGGPLAGVRERLTPSSSTSTPGAWTPTPYARPAPSPPTRAGRSADGSASTPSWSARSSARRDPAPA